MVQTNQPCWENLTHARCVKPDGLHLNRHQQLQPWIFAAAFLYMVERKERKRWDGGGSVTRDRKLVPCIAQLSPQLPRPGIDPAARQDLTPAQRVSRETLSFRREDRLVQCWKGCSSIPNHATAWYQREVRAWPSCPGQPWYHSTSQHLPRSKSLCTVLIAYYLFVRLDYVLHHNPDSNPTELKLQLY